MWLFAFVVGLVGRCHYLRLLLDWLGGIIICACCRIYCLVSLFVFVVGFIVRCRCRICCLDLLFGVVVCVCCLDLLGGAGVSAFRHDTPAKPRVE